VSNQLSEQSEERSLATPQSGFYQSRVAIATLSWSHRRVLVETKIPNPVSDGRTRGNRLTFFTGDIAELRGQLVQVKITKFALLA